MKKTEQLKVSASSPYFNSPAWYLRERTPIQTVEDRRTRKYFALEERVSPDGSRSEVLVQKDYPITPEYVSSFAASSDYHADPIGAAQSAPRRTNLGDVRHLQAALGLDFETAQVLLSEFRSVAEKLSQKQSQGASAPASVPSDKVGE